MLNSHFHTRSLKGTLSAKPFIDNQSQCILITRSTGMPFRLLWSHIWQGADNELGIHLKTVSQDGGDPKVGKQDLVLSIEEHIFGFHVPVNNMFIMRILKSAGELLHIGKHKRKRHMRPRWMALA